MTFEYKCENKSCSACPEAQLWLFKISSFQSCFLKISKFSYFRKFSNFFVIFNYFIQLNYLNITAQKGGHFQYNPLQVSNKNRVILISGHSLGDLPIDILSFALIYVAFQGWQMLMLILGRRYGVDPGAVGWIGRLPGPGD